MLRWFRSTKKERLSICLIPRKVYSSTRWSQGKSNRQRISLFQCIKALHLISTGIVWWLSDRQTRIITLQMISKFRALLPGSCWTLGRSNQRSTRCICQANSLFSWDWMVTTRSNIRFSRIFIAEKAHHRLGTCRNRLPFMGYWRWTSLIQTWNYRKVRITCNMRVRHCLG